MAEAHLTSGIAAEIQFGRGTVSDPWQGDIDALKLEMTDLKATVGSLLNKIEELERVKAEAAELHIPSPKVKSEPIEAAPGADLEEPPAPAEPENALDHEQMQVTHENQEQIDADTEPGGTSQDAGEHLPSAPPPQRQTTEELPWTSPPWGGIYFRVNPERAQRIARANEVVTTPIHVPAPPPRPREEPPPPRSPPRDSTLRPIKPIDITPATRTKRKHNFELIIETSRKRSKPSSHPAQSSSSTNSVATSSRVTLDAPSSAAAESTPAKALPGRLLRNATPRKVFGTPFVVGLDPKIRDVTVTREFMCSNFGAHASFTFSKPSQDHFDRHGYDHFVFVNGDSTPRPPFAPGEPGLITQFEDRQWPVCDRYRVFGRVGSARWQYMGLYKTTKLSAWTPTEVKNLRVAVKCYWATTIRESKWARPVLARIALRKQLGREPTKKEAWYHIKKLNDKTAPLPSGDTIITAFENGDEKAHPWKLECEDYEENLQWEIAITFPRHEKDKEKKKSNASMNS